MKGRATVIQPYETLAYLTKARSAREKSLHYRKRKPHRYRILQVSHFNWLVPFGIVMNLLFPDCPEVARASLYSNGRYMSSLLFMHKCWSLPQPTFTARLSNDELRVIGLSSDTGFVRAFGIEA